MGCGSPRCTRNDRGLPANSGIFAKTHLIENRSVIDLSTALVREKKRGEKMGMSYGKFLKTNIEKMSTFRLSTMLMKTNELHQSLHDVDENKGERRLTRG